MSLTLLPVTAYRGLVAPVPPPSDGTTPTPEQPAAAIVVVLSSPIRAGLVQHLQQARRATIKQLAELMGQREGTLVRHVNTLREHGWIEVVEITQRRGAAEQTWALVPEADRVDWGRTIAHLNELVPDSDPT